MFTPFKPIVEDGYAIRTKPVTTAPKTPNVPQGRDTFETPKYAIDLLIPFIPETVRRVWECASGNGKIVGSLEQKGYIVVPSDIRKSDICNNIIFNFLEHGNPEGTLPYEIWDIFQSGGLAIITNPPFSIKEEFIEKAFSYKVPFAFLINADYHGKHIDWIQRGCEKIIPTRRIDFITPTGRQGKTSASQFHSMWLTYGFGLGRTETFVELSLDEKKNNI